MTKASYWIADPNSGAKALVEGAAERDRWVREHGWTETEEPASGDMVWVHNANTDGRTTLPHDLLGEGSYWRGAGFVPSAPAEPVDLTKDPTLVDQPTPKRVSTTAAKADEPTTKATADKNTKE